MNDCGECGLLDCDPEYTICCGKWLCEDCKDRHDEKYSLEGE